MEAASRFVLGFVLNAAWQAPAGYGNMALTADQMKHFVSTQVYAARAWAGAHAYPDGRIGFSWSPHDATSAPSYATDLASIAARLANAIHHAYDDGGGSAARACSPSGAYTWCQCSVAGAAFNDGWDTFATW